MTLFEQVLNLHQATIKEIAMPYSKDNMTPDELEKVFIAQALIAMGDDELGPDEMWAVIKESYNTEWIAPYLFKKIKVTRENNGDYRTVNEIAPNTHGLLYPSQVEIVQ